MLLGLVLSPLFGVLMPLLGLVLSPLLLLMTGFEPGEAATVLPEIAIWLGGPLLVAWLVRRKAGVRSRERARGIAIGHAIWIGLVVVVVGGITAILSGMPQGD